MLLFGPYPRIVLLHWLATPLCLISLVSGLRLQATSRPDNLSRALASLLPQGDMYGLHLWAACGWLLLCCAYLGHRQLSRRERRRNPPSATLPAATLTGRHPLNHWLIHLGRWLVLGLVIIGLMLWLGGSTFAGGRLLMLHRWLAWGLLVYVVIHSLAQWALAGRVRAILLPHLPRRHWLTAVLVTVSLGSMSSLARPAWLWLTQATLPVPNIAADLMITIDGDASDSAWQQAPVRQVDTLQSGNDAAVVPVQIQALRQGEVIYFRFSWPDTSPSLRHLPLIKTAEGWRIQQHGFSQRDETEFYEDKLAVLFARHPDAAGAGTLQQGPQPLAGKPAHITGRAYHAAPAGELVDVWHWKAVRTHGFNQLDDSHFGPAYPTVPGDIHYTGGYRSDPLQAGGYAENWSWPGDGIVTPKRLPRDPALLAPFQQAGADDPNLYWGLSWYETRPYSAQDDHYPIGTVMPSVLWKTRLEGDRGDVRAVARWYQGVWTLEAARALAATSRFDLELQDGIYMWVAVFDHSQTRHSYHLRPLRLQFSGGVLS